MSRIALAALAVLSTLTVAGVAASAATPPPKADAERVARGKYLVTLGGCNDCHTPWKMGPGGPAPDETRLLSGHPQDVKMPEPPKGGAAWAWSGAATNTAFAGPWGVSFARNLTPDAETGLGEWTEKDFIVTLRNGRHMGHGRPLLPPMPWFNYGKATDEDLKAIFAYLRSIPAVKNVVEEPRPPPASAAAR
jgi:hypothetical protein